MRDLAGEDGAMVDLLDYAAAIEPAADAPVVALVHGIGQIQRGNSEQSPLGGWVMGGDTVARALADAIDDPEVEAILFRISSGGGSAVASDTIGHQVRRAVEQGKPVIVSMGDVAASGGYWIAMDASRIVAAPGTLTGSIGVVAGKPVLTQLWQDVGVVWGSAQRGANADMWTTTSDYSARGRARLEAFLDWTYQSFVEGVARGRDLPQEDVLEVAQGRVWTGRAGQGARPGGRSRRLCRCARRDPAGDRRSRPTRRSSFAPSRRRARSGSRRWTSRSLGQARILSVETWLERLSPGRAQHPADRDSLAKPEPVRAPA